MMTGKPGQQYFTQTWLIILLLLAGCSSVPERNPPPEELVDSAGIPWAPEARQWADATVTPGFEEWLELPADTLRENFPDTYGNQHDYLALSGGGQNGAFGAGLLCGWTEAGTRPEFTLVSGVSTGALIAPFAFLGSAYDDVLEDIYTRQSTDDLMKAGGLFRILTGESAADSEPLRERLKEFITADIVAAIAREHRRGRGLQVVTTNLDASRPVSWDIGEIAASEHPEALELIREILLASASIPGVFPPVIFEVEVNGERYDELHVDGGATSILHLYPIGLDLQAVLKKLEVPGTPNLYIIRNGKLERSWEPVERRTVPITLRTITSLMSSVVQGDMYRVYVAAQRDGIDYNLAYIPDYFDAVAEEAFDTAYMNELFELGRKVGAEG